MQIDITILPKLIGALSRRPCAAQPLSAITPVATTRPDRLNDWYGYVVPTYAQRYDDCVGHAWANWLECIVRRHVGLEAIPRGMQLDGNLLWSYARRAWWNGVMQGGIYIPQGWQAMINLGWIPGDSILVDVPADFESYNQVLFMTPVVQGHQVSEPWIDADRENGYILRPAIPAAGMGGHCTLGIAAAWQDGPFRPLLNSWGPDWGFHGIGLLDDRQWIETALDDGGYTCHIPGGMQRLAVFDGWRSALIKTPEAA
jgi:hypothetical protein